jgi:hypothetical protein
MKKVLTLLANGVITLGLGTTTQQDRGRDTKVVLVNELGSRDVNIEVIPTSYTQIYRYGLCNYCANAIHVSFLKIGDSLHLGIVR